MTAIDIHVHHPWTDPNDRPGYRLERLKSLAGQSGIERILALTGGKGTSTEELQRRNDCTLRLVEEAPDFYSGAMYLSPNHPPEFIREEARRCAAAGMVAIKQGIEVNARDARIDPIAEAAVELGIPVLFHAWYKMVEKYPEESDGSDIAHLARRHPDTRFIMAHLTGVGRRGVQDVEDLPNVSVDTCGGWYDTEMVEYAVRHLGAERVVYGSDYPGRDYAPQVGRVMGARLSTEDRERVLWHNAAALLGL
ncbi:MAG: amidohydrolase family protein [Armatimonadota bacterium]|nr:amidohydrolase family protein [Armatimonadota bacterium]